MGLMLASEPVLHRSQLIDHRHLSFFIFSAHRPSTSLVFRFVFLSFVFRFNPFFWTGTLRVKALSAEALLYELRGKAR